MGTTAMDGSATNGTASEALNAGDVVRLRSGGPWMTVEWCEAHWASCVWVDGQGVCQKRQFDTRLLERQAGPSAVTVRPTHLELP